MKLSPIEINDLLEALLDGYRSYDHLEMLVALKLGKNLQTIYPQKELDLVIFNLIKWAERENKILDLVWGANAKNPDNEKVIKIVHEICFVTKSQWDSLCELLKKVDDKSLLKAVCQKTFAKPLGNIDPRFRTTDFTKEDLDFYEIEAILKQSLIIKKEKGTMKMNIPSIVEFAYRLSTEKSISKISDSLNEWIQEISGQLEIEIPEKTFSTTPKIKQDIKIKLCILIVLEEILNDEILLRGEVIILDENKKNISTNIVLDLTELNIEKTLKKTKTSDRKLDRENEYRKVASGIDDIISYFYREIDIEISRNHEYNYSVSSEPMIDLFLPSKYFISMDMNKLIAKRKYKDIKIISEYEVNFRCFERWDYYRDGNNKRYKLRLQENWEKISKIFKSDLKKHFITNNFEYYICKTNKCNDLETKFKYNYDEDNKKIALSIISPFDLEDFEKSETDKAKSMSQLIFTLMITAAEYGIPFSLWTINEYLAKNKDKIGYEKLRGLFIKFLEQNLCDDFIQFVSNINKKRRKFYDFEQRKTFWYGLLCSSENPELVPSKFLDDYSDDALTF